MDRLSKERIETIKARYKYYLDKPEATFDGLPTVAIILDLEEARRERDEAVSRRAQLSVWLSDVEQRAETAERERDEARREVADLKILHESAVTAFNRELREVERLKEFHSFRILAIRVQIREWADNRPSSADIEAYLNSEELS